jgi:F-type H+-transporting ATPase subunit a
MKYINSPLEQFEIRDYLSINAHILENTNISITNILVYLLIAFFISVFYLNIFTYTSRIIYNNWALAKETIFDTVFGIVKSQIDEKKGQIYFPFMYTLFTFILISNLIGMVPYSFASTSHFALTFFLSFTVVLGATILGLYTHGLDFFSLFVPAGCPLILLPLLVLIEFISYLARNVSLGLRLAANILSGHMLLNIISGFTYKIMTTNLIFFIISLVPVTFLIIFSGLELCIAFIQAQVFVVLACSYIKDGVQLH